jgi:hypothetical protein
MRSVAETQATEPQLFGPNNSGFLSRMAESIELVVVPDQV